MRCIIAGSRSFDPASIDLIIRAVAASGWEKEITEVVSGGCRGVDVLGEAWAKARKIRVKRFKIPKAEWDRLGKKAGPMRNAEMARYTAEDPQGALICVFDGKSPGTKSMIKIAREYGLRVFVGHPKERAL